MQEGRVRPLARPEGGRVAQDTSGLLAPQKVLDSAVQVDVALGAVDEAERGGADNGAPKAGPRLASSAKKKNSWSSFGRVVSGGVCR